MHRCPDRRPSVPATAFAWARAARFCVSSAAARPRFRCITRRHDVGAMTMNRSRVPTVFSIYMLDVICCALGCVILLWQIKNTEAEKETARARKAEQEATQTLEKWKAQNSELISASAEIDTLKHALQESSNRE